MTEALADAVIRAQANFRAAWERHRLQGDDGTRLALEKARRELDEVQRVLAQPAEVVVKR